MSEWKYEKFSNLCDIVRGGSPRPINEWLAPEGIPWVKISDVSKSGTRYITCTSEFIKPAGKSKSRTVYPGDLILSNSATPGIPMFMNIEACIHDGWLLLRNFRGLDKLFCFYLLKNERKKLVNQGNGSVFTNLKTEILKKHYVRIPPLPEQKAIARILGSLDDKIELNRRMNETLEAMARAIFKDWFVDFGPTRAKMEGRAPYLPEPIWSLFPDAIDPQSGLPVGWEEKSLDQIADFLNGLALQEYPPLEGEESLPVIKIAELRSGITVKSGRASSQIPEKYIVQDGDFLFSWSGSLVAKFWTGGKGALNQHLFKVTSANYPKWFYTQWIYEHLENFQHIAASKATTMGHIQRGHLTAAKVICPQSNSMIAMSDWVAPLLDKTIKNDLESRTLAELRDALLPKLMSGEIRVKDAERLVEEVL